MTRHTRVTMAPTLLLGALLVGGIPAPGTPQAFAQAPADTAPQEVSLRELRDRVEARYQVLPLQGGILLIPKYGDTDIQSIELVDGRIAVNGQAVTAAELEERLVEDAGDVTRLSFLDPQARRVLFGIGPTPPTAADTTVADTTAVEDIEEERRPRRREGIDVDSSGDIVRIGGSIEIREDEVVTGDVVAVGGSVEIDGTVEGDVVAVGGGVELGPDAEIEGDVVAVGGTVRRAPGAVVHGKIDQVAFGVPKFRFDRDVHMVGPWFPGVAGLIGTVVWIAVLILLACLGYLFARRPIERMEYRAGTSPWKAALVGLVFQILFIPALALTSIVLAISIIGIPLLLLIPFAILALMIGALLGFTSVAKRLGHEAEERFGWQHTSPYISILVGVGLVMLLSFFGHVIGVAGGPLGFFGTVLTILGIIAQYAAWTIGLGVLLMTRFGTRYRWSDGETPEPVPAPGPPAPVGETSGPPASTTES